MGYFRKFIPLFTNVTKPLNKLLKKVTKFPWSPQCQGAFEPCMEPILQHPKMEKLNNLVIDTSHYAYSVIFSQAVESPEDLMPIAYTSGSFLDMQQRWFVTEKEVYTVYQSVLKFNLHLRGRNVYYTVITNH